VGSTVSVAVGRGTSVAVGTGTSVSVGTGGTSVAASNAEVGSVAVGSASMPRTFGISVGMSVGRIWPGGTSLLLVVWVASAASFVAVEFSAI
jgi:hypothetical protein